MIDLTNEGDISDLKKAFEYSFKGELGSKTLEFLEEFCGFWMGGPATPDELQAHALQYERGRRDVILTLKTIMRKDWSPRQITEIYRRSQT